jgi:hypothetical protein
VLSSLSSKEGVVRRCLIPLDEAEDGDLQAKLLLLKGGIKGRKKRKEQRRTKREITSPGALTPP